MLRLIRFELKKLLNIKTLICFVLLLCTLFGFVIYNNKLDKKYTGEDEIKKYSKELQPYEERLLRLEKMERNLIVENLTKKGIKNTDPNYDKEFLNATIEIEESELSDQFVSQMKFYSDYTNYLNNQMTAARQCSMEFQVDFEIRKSELVLDNIKNKLVDGKMVYEDDIIVNEPIDKTKKILKYNQLLVDNKVKFLHSNYEMKGYNFIDKAIKSLVPFLLPILVVIVCIDSISKEKDTGSFKFLLLQPHSRKKVFISKFLACVIVVFLLFMLSISIVFTYTTLKYGLEQSNYPVEYNIITLKSFVQDNSTQYDLATISRLKYSLLLIVFTLLYTMFLVCLCTLISTLSDNTINSFVVGISVILISYLLNTIQMSKIWAKFIPILNADFENIICQYSGLTGLTSIVLLIGYSAILFLLSMCIFNKKDLV